MMTMLAPFKNYDVLRTAVTQTLLQGQKKIEALKVEVYWKTGDLISKYLNSHGLLASELLPILSEDLKIEKTLFYRILKFHESFPRVAPGQLSWTHYRELIAVPDATKRARLADRANREQWGVRQLRERIFEKSRGQKKPTEIPALIEPARGQAGIFRIKETVLESGRVRKVVDLGFHVYLKLSKKDSARFMSQEQVAWDEGKSGWVHSKDKHDYFYTGELERTVDGDTLLLQIDLGHGITRRQYIRFRGVDAPPLKTPAGEESFKWLKKKLSKASRVEIRSHSVDPYGRYVADVWARHKDGGQAGDSGEYMNQALLDAGLAGRL